MHEMAITESLLRIVEENAQHNNVKKVRKIKLKIGKLTAVVPEVLRYCFEIISQGTIASDAELVMEEVPLIVYCENCKMEFNQEFPHFTCSLCGENKMEIKSGRELFIEYIEGD